MFTLNVDTDLSLKLLEKEDAKELFALVDGSRDSLRRWLPWVDSMKQEKDYEPVIEMWLKQSASHDGFQAGILYKNKLAGMAGFHGIDWSNQKTSIGYWLSEKYQGYGVMTKVVKALVNYAFENYKLNRVEIQCGVDNQKSNGIPKRLGFKQEGMIRDGEFLYDHYHDCVLYGILSREWEAKGQTK
ncbi:GNAT family N-acetyltransferase [Halobacillus amylolyticus]|uniref:GNAT family N-acetyltransferase n=1 Tax=Halobacillus amylolyticus TaxID=2932259 RepID=A0ABY4HG08_9BACI|nr:GNAT family protein [Halobacillus amylolyticus]UOR13731.1 GNAT family N-acetyltransferase [Halobacillus amylolyticus]